MSQECHYYECSWHSKNEPRCFRTICLASKDELELLGILHDQRLKIERLESINTELEYQLEKFRQMTDE